MQTQKPAEKPQSTLKAALLFGSGTLTSRILGLFRDTLLYSVMPQDMRDAWIAAFRIPNFFRRLLGEGGLSVSFIPVYIEQLKKGTAASQKQLVDGVFSLLMASVSLICLLCFVFMDPLVAAWVGGEGFSGVPGKIQMTVDMARVMVFFLFFVTLFAYFMALLNAKKKFTLSGYAPLFLNVGIVGGLLLFKDSEHLSKAAAWSVIVGVFFQALFLFFPLYKERGLPRLTLYCWSPEVGAVLRKFVPTFLGVGVLQVLGLINAFFASRLEPGALSHINLGDRLLELPLSLIAVSIGTTLLPTLSSYWSQGERGTFVRCLEKHFRLFYFLGLPAAFGLWFLGADIIEILFKRGQFTAGEVPIVADILKIYGLTLMATGSLKVFNQGFYATGDTKTPAFIALFGLTVHVILAPRLMNLYGLNGLVFSTACVSVINLVFGLLVLQARVGWLGWVGMGKHFVFCVFASSVMGLYLWQISQWSWKTGRFIVDFPILLLLIGVAGLIYFLGCGLLGIEELQALKRKFLKKRSH